jgi:asparagine synthase (glutamine-hydrolysing)
MHFGFTIVRKAVDSQETKPDSEPEASIRWQSKTSGLAYQFTYQHNDHFINDKLFFETPEYIAGIDGVLLNLSTLKNNYAENDWPKLFLQLYKRYGSQMADQLYGSFYAFVLEKSSNSLLCFTDHCSAKKVYYYSAEELLIISSSLRQVAECLPANKKTTTLNYRSAYALLTAGGMFGHETLIEGVNRLHGGQYLESQGGHTSLGKYFDYNAIAIEEVPEKKVVEQLEMRFQAALKLEYTKDQTYDRKHLATLSGGLDSRMNAGLAKQAGYQVHNLCFSQSGYADERIARTIAHDLEQTIDFVPLDEGKYIFDMEENMDIYEGAIFYLSSAHFNYAIKKLDTKEYGLIHTGLLGDAILGTYISAPRQQAPEVISKLQSTKLLPKIHQDLLRLGKEYVSEDIYNLHMRFFNVIISGSYAMENHGYLTAPFMEPQFMQTCLSMPPRYKYQQKIYIKWLNQYHPNLTKYTWEATGFRPRFTWQRSLSRFTTKAKHLWYGALGQSHKLNMTPYEYWYQSNPAIAPFLDQQFEQRIELLKGAPELQADCRMLFTTGNVLEKSHVLTLLAAVERLNIKL